MNRRATCRRLEPAAAALCAGLWLLSAPHAARARELWTSDDLRYALSVDSAFKATWLLSHAPDDPLLFPQRTTETGLFRLRLSLATTLGEHVDGELAYEQRARLMSDAGGPLSSQLLPSDAPAPYRIRPLDQALFEREHLAHHHELDRAAVALHLSPLELTLGRQALGLGRGVLFSAVDVFSPFSPLEVDREWRRGVDAIHAELALHEQLSVDVIGAADRDFEDGALLGRVRGYLGELDGALLAGKRSQDLMFAATASATLGDAEAHGEAAGFLTDGRGIEAGFLGDPQWVAKFLLGGSYRFDVGRGLTLVGEYHYNGFGLRDPGQDASLLADPAFLQRLQRGDGQTLGRHVLSLVGTYELRETVSANLSALLSPVDASGLVGPVLTFLYSDSVTFVASGYIPWGKPPSMGRPRSEYGTSDLSALLQLRVYD